MGKQSKELITETGIPHWLLPKPKTNIGIYTEQTWHEVIDRVASGETIKAICADDYMPKYEELLRYIHGSEERRDEYYKAREAGALLIEEQMLDIADAVDNEMEDVQRSALRINTRKWLLGVWNRKRYGENKQIDMNHKVIDLTKAIASANERVSNKGRLIEGEVINEE